MPRYLVVISGLISHQTKSYPTLSLGYLGLNFGTERSYTTFIREGMGINEASGDDDIVLSQLK